MTGEPATSQELELLRGAVARLRAGVAAIVFGAFGGTGLALATIWLLVKGGPEVGKHLGLLRHYFPGYTVTWPGALVGFLYGAATGAAMGWTVAWIYNWLVSRRTS